MTFQWTAEGRCRWGAEEGAGLPGWDLLQQEMEGAPARERSTEVKAGSCRPCGAAGRLGTDRPEEEEEEETQWGLTGQEIFRQRS